jgi:hypothetical protein
MYTAARHSSVQPPSNNQLQPRSGNSAATPQHKQNMSLAVPGPCFPRPQAHPQPPSPEHQVVAAARAPQLAHPHRQDTPQGVGGRREAAAVAPGAWAGQHGGHEAGHAYEATGGNGGAEAGHDAKPAVGVLWRRVVRVGGRWGVCGAASSTGVSRTREEHIS